MPAEIRAWMLGVRGAPRVCNSKTTELDREEQRVSDRSFWRALATKLLSLKRELWTDLPRLDTGDLRVPSNVLTRRDHLARLIKGSHAEVTLREHEHRYLVARLDEDLVNRHRDVTDQSI
jgi:hypothetical protein